MHSKVLVVEDEPLIRLGLIGLMEESGLDVVEAANADMAVRVLEDNPDIRLVISDVDMPGAMNGVDLAFHVRNRSAETSIIILSGKFALEDLRLPSGTRFFSKPYADVELTRTVERMVAHDGS